MTCYLSPILQDPQVNDDGTFLVSGLIWFYEAGTTTPVAAYQNEAGTVAWPNPIQLNARGETGGEIWLTSGQAYKMILENPPYYGSAHGQIISEFDNVSGVNDVQPSLVTSNWVAFTGTVGGASATAFYTDGDTMNIFQNNRRVKIVSDSGTIYGRVSSTAYNLGLDQTQVTCVLDSGSCVGTSAVSYGVIETDPSSIPVAVIAGTASAASTNDIYISWTGSAAELGIDNATYSDWPITITQTDFAALTVAGDTVLTDASIPATIAATGALSLPTAAGNLLVKWGTATIAATNTTVTYASVFPTGTLAVYLQSVNSGGTVTSHYSIIVSTTATDFVAKSATSSDYYYLAIGY